MEQHQLPPGLLFRSFLVIAGTYLLSLVLMAVSFAMVATVFFPEVFDQQVGDQFDADPARYLDGAPFWWLLAGNLVINFCLGWLLIKLAPFGQFPHCVFLSVLLFVGNLQQSMSVPDNGKWMYLLFMITFPLAVLVGGHLGLTRQLRRQQLNEQTML